jgi:hypothetical protein
VMRRTPGGWRAALLVRAARPLYRGGGMAAELQEGISREP